MKPLILSLFPGAGLLDRGFEYEGFCVLRGPDIVWGQDIRGWTAPRHKFEGIIGGPPCQDYSRARRDPMTGEGQELIFEFARCVSDAEPAWFLMENVPSVPTLSIQGYTMQRFNVNAREFGCEQNRLRSFQFGCLDGVGLVIPRALPALGLSQPCCMATEGRRKGRRSWPLFCALQGLPEDFDLPSFPISEKYRAVGNGVPVPVGRAIASAIKTRAVTRWTRVCVCQCGQPVPEGTTLATAACRKRMQRKRDSSRVTAPGPVTPAQSLQLL